LQKISAINTILGSYGKYGITEENIRLTNNPREINEEISRVRRILHTEYDRIENDILKVNTKGSHQALSDLNKIKAMQDSINYLIMIGDISRPSAEPVIKQAEGVLILAYGNIKANEKYVYFNDEADEKLYTADNLETRLTRFLHPYKVMGDFFVGKIPFIFIFWIILSILLDVIGFISFDNAFKKEEF
jgi:hypothetical protein